MELEAFDEALSDSSRAGGIVNAGGAGASTESRRRGVPLYLSKKPRLYQSWLEPGEGGLSLTGRCVEVVARTLVPKTRGAPPPGVTERLVEGLSQQLDQQPPVVQELVCRRGMQMLLLESSPQYQTPAKRQKLFEAWKRIFCSRDSGQPRSQRLELPDFVGHHWSNLAFIYLQKELESIDKTTELLLQMHPKNGRTEEVPWKWRLGKLLPKFSSLHRVELLDCVDDDVLVEVGKCCSKTLKRLVVAGEARDVTDEGLEEFAERVAKEEVLEELDLAARTSVTFTGVRNSCRSIRSLTKLRLDANVFQHVRLACGDPPEPIGAGEKLETLVITEPPLGGPDDYTDFLFFCRHFELLLPSVRRVNLADVSKMLVSELLDYQVAVDGKRYLLDYVEQCCVREDLMEVESVVAWDFSHFPNMRALRQYDYFLLYDDPFGDSSQLAHVTHLALFLDTKEHLNEIVDLAMSAKALKVCVVHAKAFSNEIPPAEDKRFSSKNLEVFVVSVSEGDVPLDSGFVRRLAECSPGLRLIGDLNAWSLSEEDKRDLASRYGLNTERLKEGDDPAEWWDKKWQKWCQEDLG